MPFSAKIFSSRDRLLLRKQALKMKKHPVFAIGKSNKVNGLAEAIKVHFQKYPLAIVNVKGRAEGTSVQEVVITLEQATGAVLVSQEPGKVILYRGWGAGDGPTHGSPKPTADWRNSAGGEGRTLHVIYLRSSYQQSDLNVVCSLTVKKNLLLRLHLLLIWLLSWTASFLTRIGSSNRTSAVIAIPWFWRSPIKLQNEADPSFHCES